MTTKLSKQKLQKAHITNRLYRTHSEKSLNKPTITTTNNNNNKSWGRVRESDFGMCHIILFKMFNFGKKKSETCKEMRKYDAYKRKRNQSIKNVPEEGQILDLLQGL